MFGFVTADPRELTVEEKRRYGSVYCGICRAIRLRSSRLSRMCLSYDMAFLALLHMSLYEPEEAHGKRACGFHPIKPRPWTDSPYIQYAADMNVALAYYNCLDDWQDDRSLRSKLGASVLKQHALSVAQVYPRQWQAITQCMDTLRSLEQENCTDPDLPAGAFGTLMGELLVYKKDLWADTLRQMGMALGRFIYLADAAADYETDCKKGRYNPFSGKDPDPALWETWLIMAMGRCTDYYERLPLVQDKKILDNILYGGVWLHRRRKEDSHGRGSL